MTPFRHQPVLLREAIELLNLQPGMKVVDCTVGGGGHARAILDRILPSGFLVGIDQDARAIAAAEEYLRDTVEGKTKPYVLIHHNFSQIKEILRELGIRQIDGALMDLGVSSYQLEEGERGFSYRHSGSLDMRMDPDSGAPTAYDVVMGASARELEQILWRYGEERWGRRIAEFIVEERRKAPIETTGQLAAVIKKAIPAGAREEGPHPAKRSFQALRIYVNRELEILDQAVADTVGALASKGRLAVITFHSLEDRIIKGAFKELATGCTCPKDFPVCVCGKTPQGGVLTPKPVLPRFQETEENPRSRSAKLRAFQKA